MAELGIGFSSFFFTMRIIINIIFKKGPYSGVREGRKLEMNLHDHILQWNHISAKVVDIRHKLLEDGEERKGYKLPANVFLYIVHGRALISLDDRSYRLSRCNVLHGGCGARLDLAAEERFEYFLILYKAMPLPSSPQRLEADRMLRQPFSFVPQQPLPLLDMLKRMYAEWAVAGPLELFHARALFYQFVHELLRQMQLQKAQPVQPDLLAQMLRHMHDRYMEPITLATLAELFGCSVSYVTKLFKTRLNESPIRLLTSIRMEAAAKLLIRTDAPLQEIAEMVGYPDAHALSRSFKKHFRLPPAQFRMRSRMGGMIPELPSKRMRSALDAVDPQCYSVNDRENHSHSSGIGGFPVHHVSKSAYSATSALLLCTALLLGACSNTSNSEAASSGASEPTVSDGAQPSTRTYTGSKGAVTIPANPTKIIDLTGSSIGNLLLFGITPLAATSDALNNPYHKESLKETVDLGEDPNVEAMLALEPDLIIAFDYMDEAYYETLEKVAPVVQFRYGAYTPAELIIEYGLVTGKEDIARDWVTQWDSKISEVKPKIAAAIGDKTVSILQPHAKGIYAWGNKGGRGGEILYNDLGLKAPPIIQKTLIDGDGYEANLSMEQLSDYAGDYIFTSNWGYDGGDPDVVYGSNLWKSLPAVRNNRVFFIDADAAYYTDAITLETQLEFISASLLPEQSQ